MKPASFNTISVFTKSKKDICYLTSVGSLTLWLTVGQARFCFRINYCLSEKKQDPPPPPKKKKKSKPKQYYTPELLG